MKTIAIPVFGNRISNRLDSSENVLLVAIENDVIKKRESYYWALANPLEKIDMLRQFGVEVLICDGITEFCSNQLANTPIEVIPWVSGEIEDILIEYLAGQFSKESRNW
jgi:predicted Fe-Mo cluster-binding NifX family protein